MVVIQVMIFAFIRLVLVGEAISVPNFVSFPNFNSGVEGNFSFLNNASMTLDALQVTPDTGNRSPIYSLQNRSGRVILRNRYKIWAKSSTSENGVASFNSFFVLNISPVDEPDETAGEGLAFIITSATSSVLTEMPTNSHGQWLGLFNSSTNRETGNQMVAVEFDTKQNAGTNDPDGNHVGINVNNINSTRIVSLDPAQINLKGGANYSIAAWIQYHGGAKQLDVYVARSPDPRPLHPNLSLSIDLSDYLDQSAYFGFSASTGNTAELNCILSWKLTVEEPPIENDKISEYHLKLIIALFVAVPAALAAMVAATGLFVKHCSSLAKGGDISGALEMLPGRPREFRYADLKKATHNFSVASELGRGGFGAVYKGILPKEKTAVAVKLMLKEFEQGKQEFVSEISIISQLRHRNLVPLLGWCHNKGRLMMVYEYMPNRGLDKHIFQGLLDWEQRYNIVAGVASALFYLHEECTSQVVHRDVKASNVMLDSGYNARLGDFGFARLRDRDGASYSLTNVAGTIGYIAPECSQTGRATPESDVYSFGAMALEVACGRPPIVADAPDLATWVWKLYGEDRLMDAADRRVVMPGGGNVNVDNIMCLLKVGLACSIPNPADRPTMRQVTQILARNMPPPFVPQLRPPFIWPYASSSCLTKDKGLSFVDELTHSFYIIEEPDEESN